MKLLDLVKARNEYSYPAGHIKLPERGSFSFSNLTFIRPGDSDVFKSSTELDDYHYSLLNDSSKNTVLLGIASVQYWGRCFVKGRENHNQAQVRTQWLFEGNARSNKTIFLNDICINSIEKIITFIKENNIANAFWEIKKIPHFGVSFGSKLLTFIDPNKVGIYDSHIARYLCAKLNEIEKLTKSTIENNFILESPTSFRSEDKIRFQNYCLLLQNLAIQLNSSEKDFNWTDWDGERKEWRAVDVERAFFFLAQNEN